MTFIHPHTFNLRAALVEIFAPPAEQRHQEEQKEPVSWIEVTSHENGKISITMGNLTDSPRIAFFKVAALLDAFSFVPKDVKLTLIQEGDGEEDGWKISEQMNVPIEKAFADFLRAPI